MSTLTREAILGAPDVLTQEVEVPEWGGKVLVKMMTGKERDAFEQSLFVGEGKYRKQDTTNLRAKLAARTIVDDQGNLLFSDKDVEALGNKSSSALDRVFAAAQSLNKISDDDMEEMAKN